MKVQSMHYMKGITTTSLFGKRNYNTSVSSLRCFIGHGKLYYLNEGQLFDRI